VPPTFATAHGFHDARSCFELWTILSAQYTRTYLIRRSTTERLIRAQSIFSDCRVYQRNDRGDVPHSQLSRHAKHPIPGAPKMPVFARVSSSTSNVVTPIKFNSQLNTGGGKICNVVADWELPFERNPKLRAPNSLPKSGFRRRLRIATRTPDALPRSLSNRKGGRTRLGQRCIQVQGPQRQAQLSPAYARRTRWSQTALRYRENCNSKFASGANWFGLIELEYPEVLDLGFGISIQITPNHDPSPAITGS